MFDWGRTMRYRRDERHLRRWVAIYRAAGYQPVPSDPRPASEGGRKKPLIRYAEHWESPLPEDTWERFFPSGPNVQVMTGRHWGLCVLDFDGAEAVDHAAANWRRMPRTWRSWHSDSGRKSCHLWFGLPDGLPERRKTRLYGEWEPDANGGRGDWRPHVAVELLCDRSLIMAPPSFHPSSGNNYGFEHGLSPMDIARPAMLPSWVWDMPAVEAPRPPAPAPAARPKIHRAVNFRRLDFGHVADSIPDKAAVARSWGLRFAPSAMESKGWVSVHDFNREDRRPSARFHLDSGCFWRPGERAVPFFKLGVAMGVYASASECCAALADWHGVTN